MNPILFMLIAVSWLMLYVIYLRVADIRKEQAYQSELLIAITKLLTSRK